MQTFSAKKFDMEHQGERLKALIKAKGYNISQIADNFGLTRAAIEKHLKSERLSRKVVKPYSEKFDFSLDAFFDGESIDSGTNKSKPAQQANQSEDIIRLQRELIDWQQKYIVLQNDYLELTKRFFPNAAQREAILA